MIEFLLRFLSFLYHTVEALSGPDWTEALVVGNACRLSQVAGRPAVDQMRFPDEWPAHGDVIGIPFLHETFDQMKGAIPPHEDHGHMEFFFERF